MSIYKIIHPYCFWQLLKITEDCDIAGQRLPAK